MLNNNLDVPYKKEITESVVETSSHREGRKSVIVQKEDTKKTIVEE